MSRNWKHQWKDQYWDNKDPWQRRDAKSSYGWLKRSLVAVILFALAYGAAASHTAPGQAAVAGLRYLLTTQTNFVYLREQLIKYMPQNADYSLLKRVQSTLAKPADPLMYMSCPVNGKVVSQFGWQADPVSKKDTMHEGIEMEAPVGTVVHAAAAGRVKTVIVSTTYGKMLIIEHSEDIDTVYGRLGDVMVKPGDIVSQGQVIARMGNPDGGSQPLLYFEVREKGQAIDPVPRIQRSLPVKEGE